MHQPESITPGVRVGGSRGHGCGKSGQADAQHHISDAEAQGEQDVSQLVVIEMECRPQVTGDKWLKRMTVLKVSVRVLHASPLCWAPNLMLTERLAQDIRRWDKAIHRISYISRTRKVSVATE